MQVLVEVPDDVSDRLLEMAEGEQVSVQEIAARILGQAVFATASNVPLVKKHGRSFLELDGLGAEIWKGVDAQEYVSELRREWDKRP